MPVIKSAKKRMIQNRVRRARNFPLRSEMKTLIKVQIKYIKDGDKEKATTFLKEVYSIIDKAVKKNIIHQNNGARKKSSLARMLNELVKS